MSYPWYILVLPKREFENFERLRLNFFHNAIYLHPCNLQQQGVVENLSALSYLAFTEQISSLLLSFHYAKTNVSILK